jgi:hypothetical protein
MVKHVATRRSAARLGHSHAHGDGHVYGHSCGTPQAPHALHAPHASHAQHAPPSTAPGRTALRRAAPHHTHPSTLACTHGTCHDAGTKANK